MQNQKKKIGWIIFGLVCLVCFIFGKELWHELVFEGQIYIEPKSELEKSDAIYSRVSQEDINKIQKLNDSSEDINWSLTENYEEGENDKALYIISYKDDGVNEPIKDYNDAYQHKYIDRWYFRWPNTENLYNIVFKDVYLKDFKVSDTSCSWQYEGDYLGCKFKSEAVYTFDKEGTFISQIYNLKWTFRNKYIKLKRIKTNMDYDFEGQLKEVIDG